jgi:hypothetical protein
LPLRTQIFPVKFKKPRYESFRGVDPCRFETQGHRISKRQRHNPTVSYTTISAITQVDGDRVTNDPLSRVGRQESIYSVSIIAALFPTHHSMLSTTLIVTGILSSHCTGILRLSPPLYLQTLGANLWCAYLCHVN